MLKFIQSLRKFCLKNKIIGIRKEKQTFVDEFENIESGILAIFCSRNSKR